MKKIVFGIGMLISGVIGLVSIIVAVFASGISNYDWLFTIVLDGLIVPFIIFIVLAVLGLAVAIFGLKKALPTS